MKFTYKRTLSLILALIMVIGMFPTSVFAALAPIGAPDPQGADEIAGNPGSGTTSKSATIEVGGTVTLNGYSSEDQWNTGSVDTNIITFTTSGNNRIATGAGPGVVTFTRDFFQIISYRRHMNYTITVEPYVYAQDVTVKYDQTINPVYVDVGAYTGTVSYQYSFDTAGIAEYDASANVVRGIDAGSTGYTVTVTANGQSKTKTGTITVVPTISASDVSVYEDQSANVAYIAAPSDCDITYTIGDSSIATVDAAGAVTGVSAGSTTVTVTASKNGQAATATANVTVTAPVTGITVMDTNNKTVSSVTIYEGDTVGTVLKATYTQEEGTSFKPQIKWNSSNTNAVTVYNATTASSVANTLLAGTTGEATVTASAGKTSADVSVLVRNNVKSLEVTGGIWNEGTLVFYDGTDTVLTPTMTYWSDTAKKNYNITWNVTDSGNHITTADADNNGKKFSAKLNAGETEATAQIVLTAGDDEYPCTRTINVVIKSVEFKVPSNLNLFVGGGTGAVTIYSDHADVSKAENIVWHVNDTAVATVTAKTDEEKTGAVKAVAAGTTEVYATLTYAGKEYTTNTVKVTATSNVGGIQITKWNGEELASGTEEYSATIAEGVTVQNILAEIIKSSGASTQNEITWTSSDSTVATVKGESSGTATVTAVKEGIADIVAFSEGKSATVHVTVKNNISAVNLPTSYTISKNISANVFGTGSIGSVSYLDPAGRRISLEQTVGGYEVSFASSDPSVLKVESNGQITGVSAGDAVMTVTVNGRAYKVNVKVNEYFVSYRIKSTNYTLDLTGTKTLDLRNEILVTYFDDNGVKQETALKNLSSVVASYTNYNTDVIEVDNVGNITASDVGNATVAVNIGGTVTYVAIKVVNGETEPEPTGNIYTVTIKYLYGTESKYYGTSTSQSIVLRYTEGDQVNIIEQTVPKVEGYDASETSTSIYIEKISSNIERVVYYNPATVKFTVKHFLETEISNVYENDARVTDQFDGKTEESVSLYVDKFDTHSFPNYYKTSYKKNQIIAADGSTEVNVRYKRDSFLVKFVLDGGIGVDSIYAPWGSTVYIGTPTREGYIFAGWKDEDGVVHENMETLIVPTKTVTYTAVWTPRDDIQYTVITWLQNADDDDYAYGGYEVKTGTSGEQTNVTAEQSITRTLTASESEQETANFTLSANGIEQQTVNGDGSTIVNVYYDRVVYTLTMKYKTSSGGGWGGSSSYKTAAEIQARCGAYIGDKWQEASNKAGGSMWTPTESQPYTSFLDRMPTESRTYYQSVSQSGSTQTAYYYLQKLDGTYDENNADYTVSVKNSSSLYVTIDEDFFDIKGFTQNYTKSTKEDKSFNGAKFYYTRNSYTISYYLNSQDKVEDQKFTVLYGAALDSDTYNYTPEKTDYIFMGWYEDELYQKAFDFTQTMPANNIILYAKWEPVKVTLTVIAKAWTKEYEVGKGLTLMEAASAEDWNQGIVNPDAWISESDGNFQGWFEQADDGFIPFVFDTTRITKDTTVVAQFKGDNEVNIKIQYIGYYEDGSTTVLCDTYEETAYEGEGVTYTAENVGGNWYPETTIHNITLKPDQTDPDVTYDSLTSTYTYTFKYHQRTSVNYTVRYLDAVTNKPLIDEETESTSLNVVTVNAKTITVGGVTYQPTERTKTITLTGDDSQNVITFYYNETDGKNATIDIYYWIEDPDHPGTYKSTVYVALTGITATVGQAYTVDKLDITGYEYKNEQYDPASSEGKVTKDGLTINVYYDCIDYAYSFKFVEYGTNTELAKTVSGTSEFQSSESMTAYTIPGYECISETVQTIEKISSHEENNKRIFYYQEAKAIIYYEAGEGGSVTPIYETQNAVTAAATQAASGATATPASGYQFVGWYKDPEYTEFESESAEFKPPVKSCEFEGNTYDIYESATYYAKFEVVPYHVTVNVVKGTASDITSGTPVAVASGKVINCTYGDALNLQFAPLSGYALDYVEVDGVKTSGALNPLTEGKNYSFPSVTDGHEITVVYAEDSNNNGVPDKYQVKISYQSNDTSKGTVSRAYAYVTLLDSTGSYTESITKNVSVLTEDLIAEATPVSGYKFLKWTLDGAEVNLVAGTKVTGPVTYIAKFDGYTYNVRYFYGSEEGGRPYENAPLSGTAKLGTKTTISIDTTQAVIYNSKNYVYDGIEQVKSISENESNNIVIVKYELDEGPKDGIPDKYQRTVTYEVAAGDEEKGTVSLNSAVVTLYKDGKYDVNGTGYLKKAQIATATPNEGFSFEKWTNPAGAAVTVTEKTPVTEDITYAAHFKATTYKYNVEYYYDNEKADRPDSDYPETGTQVIGEIPAPSFPAGYQQIQIEGYNFVWEKTVPVKNVDGAAYVYTVKVYYATDNLSADPDDPTNPDVPDGIPDKYQVKVTFKVSPESKGTVSPAVKVVTLQKDGVNTTAAEGGTAKLEAEPTVTPASGYAFDYWSNGTAIVGKLTNETINSNVTYTANLGEDVISSKDPDNPDVPDEIPDSHQGKVVYKIIGGYWDTDKTDNAERTHVFTVESRDPDTGLWTETGAVLGTTIPKEANIKPDDTHSGNGLWTDEAGSLDAAAFTAATVVAKGITKTYTYTFDILQINKTEAGSKPAIGEDLVFTITIKNLTSGSLDDIVTVEEPEGNEVTAVAVDSGSAEYKKNGNAVTMKSLAAGATATFTVKHTVTVTDMVNGGYTNNATVTGPNGFSKTVTKKGETEKLNTSVAFKKTNTVYDSKGAVKKADSDGKIRADAGDIVKYTFTVKNTGNVPYFNLTISDTNLGWTSEAFALAPNAEKTFSPENTEELCYRVTAADILYNTVENEATLSGSVPDDPNAEKPNVIATIPEEKATSDVPTAQINKDLIFTKTTEIYTKASGYKEIAGEDYKVDIGDRIVYMFCVKNNGNVNFSNVKIYDDRLSKTWTVGTLEMGKEKTETQTYYVTSADIEAQGIQNTATATATIIGSQRGGDNTIEKTANVTTDTLEDRIGEDDPEGPDGIPDIYQTKVHFAVNDPAAGSVTPQTKVVTLYKDGEMAQDGSADLKDVARTLTVNKGYTLDDWTKSTDTDTATLTAEELEEETITGEVTYTANLFTDVIGGNPDDPNYPGDGIPDKYQKIVKFQISNGNGTVDGEIIKTVVATLEKDGKRSTEGTATVAVPQNIVANTGYTPYSWEETELNGKTEITVKDPGEEEVHVYICETDVLGGDPDDPGDDIPDRFQRTVKFEVKDDLGEVEPEKKIVTLLDGDGNWSETGSVKLGTDPTVTPDYGYALDYWTKPGASEGTTETVEGKLSDEVITDNITYTADVAKDAMGGPGSDSPKYPDEPDGIPDKYQKKVTFQVNNGTIEGKTSKSVVVTLEKNGKRAEDGTATVAVPQTVVPDKNYIPDGWVNGELEGKTEISVAGTDSVIYVYNCELDEIGGEDPGDPDYPGDGIPDKYQRTVTFVVKDSRGTVSPAKKVVTLLDSKGEYAVDGSAVLGMEPDLEPEYGYALDYWKKPVTDAEGTKDHVLETALKDEIITDDITYTAVLDEDTIGGPDSDEPDYQEKFPKEPDGIPDKYQKIVTFQADHGTIDGKSEKTVVALLTDSTGKRSTEGTATVEIPQTIVPDTNYALDGWKETELEGKQTTEVSGTDSVTYTYICAEDVWNTDPTKPDTSDGIPDSHQGKVIYNIRDGFWTGTDAAPKTYIFTLEEKSKETDAWEAVSPVPTLGNTVPKNMIPDEDHKDLTGIWIDKSGKFEMSENVEVVKDVTEYTYIFDTISSTKKADNSLVGLGETLKYTITVENRVDMEMENVQIKEAKGNEFGVVKLDGEPADPDVYSITEAADGDVLTIKKLAGKATVTAKVEHTVTVNDIVAGKYENTATVSYGDIKRDVKTDGTTETLNTSIEFTKTGKIYKSDGTTPRGEGEKADIGDRVKYSFTVTNTGNVPYIKLQIKDNGWTSESFDLDVGKTKTFTDVLTHIVTSEDIKNQTVYNTATVAGGVPDSDDPTGKTPISGVVPESKAQIDTPVLEDKIGEDDPTQPDGIPDKYQRLVTINVENGKIEDTEKTSKDYVVTLRDPDGNLSTEGTAELDVPEFTADEGFINGKWNDPAPAIKEEKIQIGHEAEKYNYTYAFEKGYGYKVVFFYGKDAEESIDGPAPEGFVQPTELMAVGDTTAVKVQTDVEAKKDIPQTAKIDYNGDGQIENFSYDSMEQCVIGSNTDQNIVKVKYCIDTTEAGNVTEDEKKKAGSDDYNTPDTKKAKGVINIYGGSIKDDKAETTADGATITKAISYEKLNPETGAYEPREGMTETQTLDAVLGDDVSEQVSSDLPESTAVQEGWSERPLVWYSKDESGVLTPIEGNDVDTYVKNKEIKEGETYNLVGKYIYVLNSSVTSGTAGVSGGFVNYVDPEQTSTVVSNVVNPTPLKVRINMAPVVPLAAKAVLLSGEGGTGYTEEKIYKLYGETQKIETWPDTGYALDYIEVIPVAGGTTMKYLPKELTKDGSKYVLTITGITGDYNVVIHYEPDTIAEGVDKSGSDGIPDKYQRTVTFAANNGTLSFTKEVVTLKKNGEWSETGTAYLERVPTATADSGYSASSKTWSPSEPTNSTVITNNTTFTVTYTASSTSSTTTSSSSPATGDESNVLLYSMFGMSSLACLAYVGMQLKKKKEHD